MRMTVNILWIALLLHAPARADETQSSALLYRELVARHDEMVNIEREATRVFLDALGETPARERYQAAMARVNETDQAALQGLERIRVQAAQARQTRERLLQEIPTGEERRVQQELELCRELIEKIDGAVPPAQRRLHRLAEKARERLAGAPEPPIRAAKPTPTPKGGYAPMRRF